MKKLGIVGATGLVGLEFQKLLPEFFPNFSFQTFLFAYKERPSEGVLEYSQNLTKVNECDVLLNASSNEIAQDLAKNLQTRQILIDNSSAFRLDPKVPLIVPEVNGDLLRAKPSVVANPNCTATLLTVALAPLKKWGLNRVVVSTYQAASGAGIKGLEELDSQILASASGKAMAPPQVFPAVLFGNVLSHNTPIRPITEVGAGYNDEEWKVIQESRKILDLPELSLSTTCIRVPVKRAHTEAVTVDLDKDISLSDLRKLFESAKGLKVVDDWEKNHFPMPLESQNQDLVFIGRLRKDPYLNRTLHFIISGDQIRKGAASNALQILKVLWN